MAYLVSNSYFGMIVEATRGTMPTTGTPVFTPVSNPQVTPHQMFLKDEALRGSPVTVYDQVAGVRSDDYEFKTYLYASTFPNYFRALLGGTDTVTGTYTTGFTHKIPLLNSASTGSQPNSYTLLDFDGANYFTITGAQMASLGLTFGAETAAEAAMKWVGNPYGAWTTAPTVFSSLALNSEPMIPSWDASISIGGTSLSYIQSGELTIDRKTAPIYTLGQQAPYVNFAGPVEVTGKFTAVVNSNSDAWSTGSTAYALNRNGLATVITLTNPNSSIGGNNYSITLTMSSTQLQDVKRTRGKSFTEIEVTFTANANSTDASTGYAPITTSTLNTIVTATA